MIDREYDSAESARRQSEGARVQRLTEEASHLWRLAADLCCWGFVAEAADTRRLAVARRVQAILAGSLSAAEAAPETDC